jgi:hypothetical protein
VQQPPLQGMLVGIAIQIAMMNSVKQCGDASASWIASSNELPKRNKRATGSELLLGIASGSLNRMNRWLV